MSRTLSELVTDVAAYTADLDMDDVDWQRASAVNGLLATDQYVDTARYWVDRAVKTQTDAGQLAYGSDIAYYSNQQNPQSTRNSYSDGYFPTYNPAAMAWSTLEFYERTEDDRYLDAVRRQYEYLVETVDRTTDGGISRREQKIELFTEIYSFACPFFVRYGVITDQQDPVDEAVYQVKVHAKHLQDPETGLFRHVWHESPDFYPASSYWGRAIGWATTGLVDTLLELPDDHPEREAVIEILRDAVAGAVEYQDNSGFWRQRVDDPRSPLEASGTLMLAYTLKRGVDEGFLDERYETPARDAIDACEGIVTEEGAVRRIAHPPASAFAPLGTTAYGQGWFLLAANCFL